MNASRIVRAGILVLGLVAPLPGLTGLAAAGENAPAPANVAEPPSPEELKQVKKLFASYCSWCHGNYGLVADKAPVMAGTLKTAQQVHDQLHNGKDGYMPAFKDDMTEDQIWLFVRYVKTLTPLPE